MKIIGIDPGYATIGYGIVDYRNTRFTTLDYGAVITTPDHPFPERLLQIYEEICAIMERHRPEAAAIEKLFITDTLPEKRKASDKIQVLSIAHIFADAIKRNHDGTSISEMFK